jgi:PAS domain S-box-containing protein
MQELARVRLENEMDLILAHKRAMKLAELAGLSLSAQTTFATAVSEVARTTCESGACGILVLGVVSENKHERYIVASLHGVGDRSRIQEGLRYARRLVSNYKVSEMGSETVVDLFFGIGSGFRIDVLKLDEWRRYFRNEPPVSPYDELKRRNEQLQELSARVQKSEAQYKTLTNALPLFIFSLNSSGELVFANEWLQTYTGATTEVLNRGKWKTFIHPDDYGQFAALIYEGLSQQTQTQKLELRIRQHASGAWFWHQMTLTLFQSATDEIHYWIGYIADIHAQKIVEETLKDNIELKQTQAELREQKLTLEKTVEELNRSNYELQQFAFVASHDLQEPIRKILFYSDSLSNRFRSELQGKGIEYLENMQRSASRMRALINDILAFSQINRSDTAFATVDLQSVAAEAMQELELAISEKGAIIHVGTLPSINGDATMLRQLFSNLVGNAVKYSKQEEAPAISISAVVSSLETILSFKDNGIGFDEKYAPQLFRVFQRLQHKQEYGGTGIGLAICKKIVEVHGGRIWAESSEGIGTTFHVSLPSVT